MLTTSDNRELSRKSEVSFTCLGCSRICRYGPSTETHTNSVSLIITYIFITITLYNYYSTETKQEAAADFSNMIVFSND